MGTPLQLLLIEDSADDADLLVHRLTRSGFDVQSERVDTREALEQALKTREWDVVLGDYNMPMLDAEQAITIVHEQQPQTPFIVVSGAIDEHVAASLMERGVRDYFAKDNLVRLAPAIQRELTEKANREERHELSRRLRYQAHHDSLTGLPDRSLFNGRLVLALQRAARHGTSCAVFSMNVDHFKDINEVMGHEAGDYFLKEAARRMQACLGASDMLCRLGGDEFLLFTSNASVPQVCLLAQRLLDALRQPFRYRSRTIRASACMGVSLYPQHGDDAHVLLTRADAALEAVKQTGNHAFLIFDENAMSQALKRKTLFKRLQRATQGRELEPFYQPRYNAHTRRITGLETLLRWCVPGLDARAATDFFTEIETHPELLPLLDRLMWQSACQQSRLWRQAGYGDIPLGLHLSAGAVCDDESVNQMATILQNSSVRPDQVELSVSMSEAMENMDRVLPVLSQFRAMGVSLTLDDVGIEPVFRHELQEFPVQRLRLHTDIVHRLPESAALSARVLNIVEQAHGLGMKVCAKGVETDSQLVFLNGVRVDEMQGFLLGSPMPACEAEDFLYLLPAAA